MVNWLLIIYHTPCLCCAPIVSMIKVQKLVDLKPQLFRRNTEIHR
ncbi:hypothetical protein BOH78_5070 [Pichia kudriavzevii]|uniref:Uncharacterized protein n=2 Tax=Pichia kudriavzevii TaxID=4909 RepID=A0A1V2LFN2_PICKU|nr:hypothetical protein BOH78_5070 [Pichia kudriavzevii]